MKTKLTKLNNEKIKQKISKENRQKVKFKKKSYVNSRQPSYIFPEARL